MKRQWKKKSDRPSYYCVDSGSENRGIPITKISLWVFGNIYKNQLKTKPCAGIQSSWVTWYLRSARMLRNEEDPKLRFSVLTGRRQASRKGERHPWRDIGEPENFNVIRVWYYFLVSIKPAEILKALSFDVGKGEKNERNGWVEDRDQYLYLGEDGWRSPANLMCYFSKFKEWSEVRKLG